MRRLLRLAEGRDRRLHGDELPAASAPTLPRLTLSCRKGIEWDSYNPLTIPTPARIGVRGARTPLASGTSRDSVSPRNAGNIGRPGTERRREVTASTEVSLPGAGDEPAGSLFRCQRIPVHSRSDRRTDILFMGVEKPQSARCRIGGREPFYRRAKTPPRPSSKSILTRV